MKLFLCNFGFCVCLLFASCVHVPSEDIGKKWFDAIKQGNTEQVKAILKCEKVKINLQDENGTTALHHAFGQNNIALAKWLIEQGADIKKKNSFGATPLDYAHILQLNAFREICMYGNKESVKALLKYGFSRVNEMYKGRTPLMYATQYGDFEVVKYLVNSGADINIKSTYPYKATALGYAFFRGKPEIYMFLLETIYKDADSRKLLSQKVLLILDKINNNKVLSENDKQNQIKTFIAKEMIKHEKSSSRAMEWLKESAENGDAESQYLLGMCYKDAKCGIEQDYTNAFKWLKLAVKQEYKQAKKPLESCYKDLGYSDDKRDIELLLKLAKQNDVEAQYQLAFHYRLKRNYSEAFKYLTQAGKNGHFTAQLTLGDLYHKGKRGIQKNPTEAIKWYKRAITTTKDPKLKKDIEEKLQLLQKE